MSNVEKGVEAMMDHMRNDYIGWSRSGGRDISEEILSDSEKRYCDNLHYTVGSKYIKISNDGTTEAFVVNTEKDKKFALGDILKPAGWATPARNFRRGNVLDRTFGRVRWTGPY